MKNILVLTDFSRCADNAVRYAINLQDLYDIRLVFYHITYQHFLKEMPKAYTSERIINNQKDSKEYLIKNIEQNYFSLKKPPLNNKCCAIYGAHLTEKIDEIIKTERIDMIIMGTKGATGLDRVLYGSNAVKVIDQSSCPVLSIPLNKKFKKPKKILLFSELNDLKDELLDVIPIAKKFNCQLEICHLTNNTKAPDSEILQIINTLKQDCKYENIHLTTVKRVYEKNLVTQIELIVSSAKPDIICLHTLKYNWFEKLFTFSYTKDLVYHSKSSILTFSRTKPSFYLPTL